MKRARSRSWTRDELLLAMNLYCRLPFGKQHARNLEVIKLAEAIGRTPGSVAMKLNNFTSLDPVEKLRGVRGLTGASKLDPQIWDEFHPNRDELTAASEVLWQRVVEEHQVGRRSHLRVMLCRPKRQRNLCYSFASLSCNTSSGKPCLRLSTIGVASRGIRSLNCWRRRISNLGRPALSTVSPPGTAFVCQEFIIGLSISA